MYEGIFDDTKPDAKHDTKPDTKPDAKPDGRYNQKAINSTVLTYGQIWL